MKAYRCAIKKLKKEKEATARMDVCVTSNRPGRPVFYCRNVNQSVTNYVTVKHPCFYWLLSICYISYISFIYKGIEKEYIQHM